MATQHLQVLGAGAGADSQREGVVKLVNDEIEVHCLLPVHIRVTDGQLTTVSSVYFHLSLERSVRSLLTKAKFPPPFTNFYHDGSIKNFLELSLNDHVWHNIPVSL